MAAKHNAIFLNITFRAPEVTWLNNTQILIAISHNQEISSLLFMLNLYRFNVEDILLLDLEIFISFNNPDPALPSPIRVYLLLSQTFPSKFFFL